MVNDVVAVLHSHGRIDDIRKLIRAGNARQQYGRDAAEGVAERDECPEAEVDAECGGEENVTCGVGVSAAADWWGAGS